MTGADKRIEAARADLSGEPGAEPKKKKKKGKKK